MLADMSQESELNVWGISKIFRRNLVIGVIVMLMTAIAVLARALIEVTSQRNAKNTELVVCKQEAADLIDKLRLDQIAFITKMLERQQQIEQELRDAQKLIKK